MTAKHFYLGDLPRSDLPAFSPVWVTKLKQAEGAEQLAVVAAYAKTAAWFSMHERDKDGRWRMILTAPARIGREGLGKTKEGDFKTPAGEYYFNSAFGIADDPGCAIEYTRVDQNTYWSGDVREGMFYNRMVSIKDHLGLNRSVSERIFDYPVEYKYCLGISYNEKCVAGRGSAVFMHCLAPGRTFTGGCVAVPEEKMKLVMRNVRRGCVVIIDSLDKLAGKI